MVSEMSRMPSKLVVLGAGGLARQIVGVVEDIRDLDILGLTGVPDESSVENDTPLLGGDEVLRTLKASYVLGVSNVLVRRKLDDFANELGKEAGIVVHPNARVEKRVSIAPGGVFMPGVNLQEGARLGRHVLANVNVLVGHEATVETQVTISPHAVIGARSRIGAGTSVGIGGIVLPDVTVGEDVVIGAGAVVTKDVPAHTTVVGVPARALAPR
jgi:acetyltransferase EpsM